MRHTLRYLTVSLGFVVLAYIIGYDMGYKQKLLRDWLDEWSDIFTQGIIDTVGKERPKKDKTA